MDHNSEDRGSAGRTAFIASADPYWEPWLSLWRAGSLFWVAPWDNALHAFAERAQFLPRLLAALNIDQNELARLEPSLIRELVERCAGCETPEQCEWDLRENPADPAWQAYCPNFATLSGWQPRGRKYRCAG